MKDANIPEAKAKAIGDVLLKRAYIPRSNFAAVAKGVSEFTKGKVDVKTAAAEMEKCNTNNDDKLTFKEVKACLTKHAKALGLNTKEAAESAKWGLAKAAVISRGRFANAVKAVKKS